MGIPDDLFQASVGVEALNLESLGIPDVDAGRVASDGNVGVSRKERGQSKTLVNEEVLKSLEPAE